MTTGPRCGSWARPSRPRRAAEVARPSLALLKPVDPVAMRDFMVFEEHVAPRWRQLGRNRGPDVWYEQPIGYFSNTATIRGPRDPIEVPGGSQRLDFELEVGAILGRDAVLRHPGAGRRPDRGLPYPVRLVRARPAVPRDGRQPRPVQGQGLRLLAGPVFVTPDELSPATATGTGYDLEMTATVNGRVYGRDRWSSASWSFEELISYASWNSRAEAGSLIGSGTCQGGCILELSIRHSPEEYPWLAPGDEVQLAIEHMGEIRAQVRPAARGPWPARRPAPTTPERTPA